jgi:hypothetical protein
VGRLAKEWLEDARRITHDIPAVGAALLRAEQGRRFNVRAVGTPDAGPGLRQGLEALEHSAVAIRGMFRAVLDATYDASWPDDETTADVLLGLAYTFRELAAGVDAFGQLVRDEADSANRLGPTDVEAMRSALEGMHEARARLEELLVSGGSPGLLELHAAVLTTVKRVLREMDLDERVRRQVRLLRPARPRFRGGPPAVPSPSSTQVSTQVSTEVPTEVSPELSAEAETQLLPRLPGDGGDPRGG